MSHKIISFCAGGGFNPEHKNMEVKNFSTSSIKQRMKEAKKSLKMRFRQLIKDYKVLFNSGKDIDEVKKLFSQDLVMILSETVTNIDKSGGTLNRFLGLTALIPGSREVSNKINLLVKKINAFYKKNGYLSKPLQVQFNSLLKELIQTISNEVMNGNVDKENLESEPNDEETNEETPVKNFSSTTRLALFASQDKINDIMKKVDLDDLPIDNVTPDSIILNSSIIPDELKDIKKFSKRVNLFSSELIPITFVVKDDESMDAEQLMKSALNEMMIKGFITVADPTKNAFNYDSEVIAPNQIKFTVYFDKDKLAVKGESANNEGIYIGKTLPEKYQLLFQPVIANNPIVDQISNIIDKGINAKSTMEIENILMGIKNPEELDLIKKSISSRYNPNPIKDLFE